ncbi:MAG: tRNA 2-thiouridine(34) synthase MnmA [Candidatus Paceibacterota bacterium]|jgi:tRNA-specific 2-thiouridylase
MGKKKVFVGLSGGVDSAVSAALLQKFGYEVIGVFIKTWHPDFLECNEEEERLDAMRVAAHLDIPFLTFDFEDVYKKEVADYMISEYKKGRTPNPDVMCNKHVKFGAFLKKAIAMGADYVATGHYAMANSGFSFFGSLSPRARGALPLGSSACETPKKGKPTVCLFKGVDPSKDQSYFLWTLKQEQLKRILFPVGHLKKTEVRKLAKKFNLPVAEKHDSQGICFLGDIDLKEFLKHYIKEKKGDVIVVPSESEGRDKDDVIGHHNGVVFHTLGERHGFTITKKSPTDGPYYIVGKDVKKNILMVSQNPLPNPSPLIINGEGRRGEVIKIINTNWIDKIPEENKSPARNAFSIADAGGYTAQIRYHGEFLPCQIKITGKSKAEIIFKKPVLVASGQSVVIYDKDICLGGGVVV